ncbi:RfbX Membrane protein involved in the export of O-antigen and teichoic acid [Methylophilaceae bacterium]
MRRVLANFWILIRGRGAAAIMAFGATALMARALGPAEFGMVILIHTYAMLVRALFDFGSMDAIVRYGVPAHDAGDSHALGRLIKVCRRIDKQASIAATLLALIVAPVAGPFMGMDSQHVILLTAYSLVLLTTGIGTAGSILRLYNRFDILGRYMTIAPTMRFMGVVIAWWLSAPIQVFVAIWAIAYAAENFYLMWHAKHKYNTHIKQALAGVSVKDAKLSDFEGLRRFLWVTYWQSNLDVLPKHITTVLVGYLLGPAEAGLLRLARELSSMLSKPAVLIRQVIFVDLTRNWNQGNQAFDVIAYHTALLGGALGLLFVLTCYFFGEHLLVTLLGQQFAAAKSVLTLMLLAATLDLAASPLRSALYAIGKAFSALRLHIFSTAIYLVLFIFLTSKFGLIGAGLATSSAAALTLIGMLLLMRKNKRLN